MLDELSAPSTKGAIVPGQGGQFGGPGLAGTAINPLRTTENLSLMSLTEVRQARNELSDLEDRVSYWRRIIQARIDLIRDGSIKRGATVEGLNRVLSMHLGRNNRLAMMNTNGDMDLPPVEGLGRLWDSSISGAVGDDEPLLEDLEIAERELSLQRSDLHGRIDAATAELVRRYHLEPQLALSALPSRNARPAPL